MTEAFSDLEVVGHEHAAHAPEVAADRDASAPERDLAYESPELDQKNWPVCSSASTLLNGLI